MNTITVGKKRLQVVGPWRNNSGRICGMTAAHQLAWCQGLGGRMPTPDEWNAAWEQAEVRASVPLLDVETASLDALHDYLIAAVETGLLVVAAKTWTRSGGNYGLLVHVEDTAIDPKDGIRKWQGTRVYPTNTKHARAIQPHGHQHGWHHVDWSQLGYCVIEIDSDNTVKVISETPPPLPPATNWGDGYACVMAWQTYLLEYFAARGEKALPVYGADGDHGTETDAWTDRYRMLQVADTLPSVSSGLPPIEFKQATKYRQGRRAAINLVVLHTAQMREDTDGDDGNAEALQSYAAGPDAFSWHYAGDSDSITQSVREEDTAYHVGTPGNDRSIGIELPGFASQSEAGWNDDNSNRTLQLVALLVADICRRHHIPVRRVAAGQLAAGEAGICGHDDVRRGLGGTTHRDPGHAFPWERFIEMVEDAS